MNQKKRYLTVVTAALLVLLPMAAMAAPATGGEAPSTIFTMYFFYWTVNFILLITAFYFILRKPLGGFLSGRRNETAKAIEEARAMKVKAEEALAEYKGKMANLEREVQDLRTEIMDAGERERNTILATAEAQSKKIIEDAHLVGDQELRRAKDALRAEVVALAARMAQDKVKSESAPADKEKQFSEFLSKLESLT